MDKKRILLVDDDPDILFTMSEILKISGFDVTARNNGKAALIAAKNHHFDVMVLDLKMPVMDGVETFAELKKNKDNPCVFFVSAFIPDDLKSALLKQGAADVFEKPLDIGKLLKSLDCYRQVHKKSS